MDSPHEGLVHQTDVLVDPPQNLTALTIPLDTRDGARALYYCHSHSGPCVFPFIVRARKNVFVIPRDVCEMITTEVQLEVLPGERLRGARLISRDERTNTAVVLSSLQFQSGGAETFRFIPARCVCTLRPHTTILMEVDIDEAVAIDRRVAVVSAIWLPPDQRDRLHATMWK